MTSNSVARPLSLVVQAENETDDGPRFQLDEEVLHQMQSLERLGSNKVAIISVSGIFRTGKSFLLNFFLRYFRALGRSDTQDWIRSEDQLDEGFHWRAGADRDTTGILIWSEPFFIRRPDGEEVAVLLMDTQGTFDHQSTQQDCINIFALCTLMSSVQILNITQKVQETDLQHLRLFVEFAAMAKRSDGKALQHLWFLIRDWQNPDEFEYGADGGTKYLNKILECDSQMPRENQELRQGIKQHFEQASCCLLPHPGSAVASSKFRGELNKLDPMFVDELEKFVVLVASPENIPVKQINGRDFTGMDFFALKKYFDAICNSGLPTPRSIFAATVEIVNVLATIEAKKFFETKVSEFFHSEASFNISSADMDKVLVDIEKDTLSLFSSRCMEVPDFDIASVRQSLQEELQSLGNRQTQLLQVMSRKKEADAKADLLAKELESQRAAYAEDQQKMEQIKADFRKQIEEIRGSSVSKEEMNRRRLQAEADKHSSRISSLEIRNSNLEGQLSQVSISRTLESSKVDRLEKELDSLRSEKNYISRERKEERREAEQEIREIQKSLSRVLSELGKEKDNSSRSAQKLNEIQDRLNQRNCLVM